MKIVVLIPVYNDWKSVFKLLDEINDLSMENEFQLSVLIVNDASNFDRQEIEKSFENINSIKILNMEKNLGHTRCIATGLRYIFEKDQFDYIIPMDGDGEDRPEEIPQFINRIESSNDKIIVGNTMKLTLACDHRTVDGATGAAFLQTLKGYIENPITMLL